MKWMIERDEFFGVYDLLPAVRLSVPSKFELSPREWHLSVGWLNYGLTFILQTRPGQYPTTGQGKLRDAKFD